MMRTTAPLLMAVLVARAVRCAEADGYCCYYSPEPDGCTGCESRATEGLCAKYAEECTGQCNANGNARWCGDDTPTTPAPDSTTVTTQTSTTASSTSLPDVDVVGFRYSSPADYSEDDLGVLVGLNCGKVRNAIGDYQRAISEGSALALRHRALWTAKATDAEAACVLAELLLAQGNATGAAYYAINAWGSVVMDGTESCTIPRPPFCVDTLSARSVGTFALLVPVGLFVLILAASAVTFFCGPTRRSDRLQQTDTMRADSYLPAVPEEPVPCMPAVADEKTPLGGRGLRAELQLKAELQDLFAEKSCLRVLGNAVDFAETTAYLFSSLQATFGFQADSVRNQFEHLLSLWRSECAMVADVSVGEGECVEEQHLLQEALHSLHGDMLDSFGRWRSQLRAHDRARVPARDPKAMPNLGGVGAQWNHERLWVFGDASSQLSAMLAEIATFLLVWGEAGNVRFMPEMLYFITELALAAGPDHLDSSRGGAHGGGVVLPPDGGFLKRVVRPIYGVVFEEWHDQVDIDPSTQKDKKKLRAGFESFLPADVANYDDWNELFCDPERLVAGIVLQDGGRLFDLDHSQRFAALGRVDWRASLDAKETKTHRELHSMWGVFASTHRIWLVHTVVFFCAVCTMARNAAESVTGGQPLGGRSELVRFAAVGLLVPLHALAWVAARWQVTGSAVRRRRGGLCRPLRFVRNGFVWLLPIATYAAVRASDDDGYLEGRLNHNYALAAHYTVSVAGLVLLLRPKGAKYNPWSLTPVSLQMRVIRYLFWACVLAIKFLLATVVIGAVETALRDLKIATPGRQSPAEIAQVYFSTGYISDVIIWLVLWSTTFCLFASDTQLCFTLVATIFGAATVLVQRGCRVCTYAFEDAVSKIPERFSRKVLPYADLGKGHGDGNDDQASAGQEVYSPHFLLIWDRIVEFLRYEDKIDGHLMGDMSFDTDRTDRSVGWEQLQQPLVRRAAERAVCQPAPDGQATRRRVKVPEVFRAKSPFEMAVKHYACLDDAHWPSNADVQWRLVSLARGLGLPMPRPFRAPYFPGITVLIPHYNESILLLKQDLFPDTPDGVVPMINWVRHKYKEEFAAFSSRMQAGGVQGGWPSALAEWEDYTDAQWGTVGTWASMRLQTLWRTVAGMSLYYHAIQCLYEAQKDESSRLARPGVWDPSDCFTCLVSMQMYKFFDATQLQQTNRMFEKFPDCLQVAFIDHELAGPSAGADGVHPRQRRRYFSCLVNRACPTSMDGRKVPKYRIELPGYPILGDGKGDNQNHAIPFMRGIFSQCIDANQGAYFEQMLLLPNALGEFRSHRRKGGLAKRIVGFPEHITSDIGSIGDFAASAEVAFGTILQRTYSVLGGRMHYGHPDIMNKLAMMQQGGVSKATKTLNLSEDIFAGMDLTLRGEGRGIRHCEYFHLAKGRDLGFNTVIGFFSKLSSGTGEQTLSRQTYRLGQVMPLPEAMTFYYAHAGYYFSQYLISAGMPVVVFVWLLVLVSDCESTFAEFQHCFATSADSSAGGVMAEVLGIWFSWLLVLFLIASSLPLFTEMWMERSFKMAAERVVKQLLTLSPLMFVFQSKVIGHYVVNEIRYGGATYVATGRGLPTERRPLVGEVAPTGLHLTKVGGLYLDYAAIAYYDGAKLLAAAVLIVGASWNQWPGTAASPWVWVTLGLTAISWLFAPFIFNPYQFNVGQYGKDLRALMAFFLEHQGNHWKDWFDLTQLKLKRKAKHSLVDIALFGSVLCLLIFFQVLNAKAEALSHVYPERSYITARHVLMLVPPIGLSLAYCLLATLLGCLCCPVLPRAGDVPSRSASSLAHRTAPSASDNGADIEQEGGGGAEAGPEARPHRRMEDRTVTQARTGSAAALGAESRGCGCAVPLPLSAVAVALLGCGESLAGLWSLVQVGWLQAFVAGILLKWCWLSLLIRLAEGALARAGGCGRLLQPVELWLYAHRMARDIFTSLLIVLVLLPFVLLNSVNDVLCQGCSAHQLLIYRDPGHLARGEAFVRELRTMKSTDTARRPTAHVIDAV